MLHLNFVPHQNIRTNILNKFEDECSGTFLSALKTLTSEKLVNKIISKFGMLILNIDLLSDKDFRIIQKAPKTLL